MRRTLKALSAAGLAVALAGSANAALIVSGGLTLNTAPSVSYQQTVDDPCIIGGNDCQNPASFPQTLSGSGGAGSAFDKLSPLYTAAQLTGVTGSTAFIVGLDYNDTSVAQTLYEFGAYYYNAGGTLIGSQVFTEDTSLKTVFNGTGFSDFLLSGFNLVAGTAKVQFQAKWFNNDGPDSYFLIGAKPTIFVPEPGTLALLGLGAFALGVSARRRRSV